MIDIIHKDNMEWERARDGYRITKDEISKLARIEFFDERESEDVELKRLRRIANFN